MIYFDTEKQAYAQKETIVKFNKIYLTECTDDVFQELQEGKKIWNDNNEIIVNPNYEARQKEKERERIAMLNMTGTDVERAIYKVKNMDFDDILAMVKDNPVIDEKALKIEFKANNFFRGNPYIEKVGTLLGFTSEMLDKFFDAKDYHYLTTCKLTINPTPTSATVTIEPNPIPYGETAHYKVEHEGYVTKDGDVEMLKDEVLEIILDENTTDTTTDISDEVEAEPTGNADADKN